MILGIEQFMWQLLNMLACIKPFVIGWSTLLSISYYYLGRCRIASDQMQPTLWMDRFCLRSTIQLW